MSNLKKYDFTFNLSGLQDYTEQKTSTLISETVLTGDFAQQVVVVPNVKGVQELNVLSSHLQELDGGCGWNPANSGQTTTFTQKSITSVKKQYQESLCVDQLEGYWYQTLLKPGQYYDSPNDIPFAEYLVNYKVEQVKEAIELMLFSATEGSTGFDGFIALTGADYTGATGNVTIVPAASGHTAANIGDSIDLMLAEAPDYLAAAKNGAIFMSWSNFRNYTVWVRNKNFFYLQTPGDGQAKILHPGSNFEVIPVHGLTGSNRIFIGKKDNFFIGTDLVSDYSQFKMWYSLDNQETRMKCQFRIGAQTGVDQIISNGLA
jgi:hypothetical protein